MMNETICSPFKEQGVCWTEEPKTSHINVGSEVIKEDPFVVLDIESPGTAHKNDLGLNTTPDLAASTFLSQYELLNKALEPVDADLTPEELFMHQMALGLYQPLSATELGPVNSQPQFGLSDPLYDTNMDWEEQARQAKSQQQLLCSTQASQPQHFQDHLRSAPSSTNTPSTHPHLKISQLPVLLDSNYPQPTQLLNFPLVTPSDVNYEYLPPPVVHETRFNLASSTFENSPPLVPRVDLNSVSSVPPLNPNHPYHTLPLYCKYPQMNTSWHLPHPSPQTPFWPGSLERPPVGESSYGQSMDSLSQFYVNYRLWQMYCKVAKSVYTSSPDAEALACFFM